MSNDSSEPVVREFNSPEEVKAFFKTINKNYVINLEGKPMSIDAGGKSLIIKRTIPYTVLRNWKSFSNNYNDRGGYYYFNCKDDTIINGTAFHINYNVIEFAKGGVGLVLEPSYNNNEILKRYKVDNDFVVSLDCIRFGDEKIICPFQKCDNYTIVNPKINLENYDKPNQTKNLLIFSEPPEKTSLKFKSFKGINLNGLEELKFETDNTLSNMDFSDLKDYKNEFNIKCDRTGKDLMISNPLGIRLNKFRPFKKTGSFGVPEHKEKYIPQWYIDLMNLIPDFYDKDYETNEKIYKELFSIHKQVDVNMFRAEKMQLSYNVDRDIMSVLIKRLLK